MAKKTSGVDRDIGVHPLFKTMSKQHSVWPLLSMPDPKPYGQTLHNSRKADIGLRGAIERLCI